MTPITSSGLLSTSSRRSSGRKQNAADLVLWIAAALIVAGAAGASAQDLAGGQKSFRKCLSCHDVGATAKNKVGPALNGLDGRKAGTIEGFNYSDANRNASFVWDTQTFTDYIRAPLQAIPNTKMPFAGIPDEKERGDLWAYLKQFAADGSKKQ